MAQPFAGVRGVPAYIPYIVASGDERGKELKSYESMK
jgi:hypothetical protein